MILRKETSNKTTWKQRTMMATLGVVVLPIGLAWFDTAEADQAGGSTSNGIEKAPEPSPLEKEPLLVEASNRLEFQAEGTTAIEVEPQVGGNRLSPTGNAAVTTGFVDRGGTTAVEVEPQVAGHKLAPTGTGGRSRRVAVVAEPTATNNRGNNEVIELREDVARLESLIETLVSQMEHIGGTIRGGADSKHSLERQLDLAKGELDNTRMSSELDMDELKDQLEFEANELNRKKKLYETGMIGESGYRTSEKSVRQIERDLKRVAIKRDFETRRIQKDIEYYSAELKRREDLEARKPAGLARFFGAVRGAVTIIEGKETTVTNAILQLGYDDFANLKKVKITRRDSVTKENKVFYVNVKAILSGDDKEEDVALQDGDRVEVSERSFVF